MKYSVAIDIGGTNTRVALADEELNIIERKQFATDSENPDVTLGKIAEVIKVLTVILLVQECHVRVHLT
jgi:glucokinase